jgi:hypothetical protein
MYPCGLVEPMPLSRREMLRSSACGFGMLALSALLQENAAAGRSARDPLAARPAHFRPRAKRVIFIFLAGGASQVDLFQHKPELGKRHGELPPKSIAHSNEFVTEGFDSTKLLRPISKFRRVGESGIWMSDLLPHLSQQIDRLTILNGMVADNPAHTPARQHLFTGSPFLVQPSMGSWVSYGLGTENRNFPSFVSVTGSTFSHRNAYLPAIHQGTALEGEKEFTIRHLKNDQLNARQQLMKAQLLQTLNLRHLDRAIADPGIEGLIESYELAFRMQAETGDLVDISEESGETLRLYGIGEQPTDVVGHKMLVARRLSEAGVRFVQIWTGAWDHHINIKANLPKVCARHDKPIAGLLEDLRRRGLLEDTLVVCTGEFGRTPFDQDLSRGKDPPETYGRGHSPQGFSAWMAGGGVKGGLAYGDTDELGYRAIEGKVHVHDLQATILHLLGLDHERLTHRYAGRDFRLTDVYGRVVDEIILPS